ncbi:MAG: hypothetical protein IJ660_01520 [Alphaproteobacteria bacterium]|nr:hypothetical protein [Alphaproteobacteria bacterium]
MFISYLSCMPEILLLLNVIILQIVKHLRKEQTPKTFASISKVFFVLTLISSIIFYNISFSKNWYDNTEYTTLIKSILVVFVLITNGIVCRWFLNQNYNSCRYYQLLSLILIGLFGIISCQHLGVLMACLSLVFVSVAMISENNLDNPIEKIKLRQFNMINNLLLILFMIGGIALIYEKTNTLYYMQLQNYYQKQDMDNMDKLGMLFVLVPILELIGCVPFHLRRLKIQKESILPVASSLSILLSLTGVAFLLHNLSQIFVQSVEVYNEMIFVCGITSVIIGAVGSSSGRNLRQIFGFLEVFNLGIILLLGYPLQNINIEVIFSYVLILILMLMGGYICLYGIRSRGNYLQTMEDIAGLGKVKPYLAGSLLIFCCSFIGIPPFLSVWGNFLMIHQMLNEQHFISLGVIFLFLIWVAYGILNIIKSIYFDKRTRNFERVDVGVYVGIVMTVVLMCYGIIWQENIMDSLATIMRQ